MHDVIKVANTISEATISIYIALICMVVIFERTANARKTDVTKNPMDIADTVKDFIWLDA